METIDIEDIKAKIETILNTNRNYGYEIDTVLGGSRFKTMAAYEVIEALSQCFLEKTGVDLGPVWSLLKIMAKTPQLIKQIPIGGGFVQNVCVAFNAVKTLTGFSSPIISLALNVGLNCIQRSSANVAEVVKKTIEEALHKFQDNEIQASAEGTIRTFRLSQAFLNTQCCDQNIHDHEAACIGSYVPIYQGVEILGILKRIIQTDSASNTNEGVERAMQYLELYSILESFRLYLLIQMYTLVKSSPKSTWTAQAIYNVIVEEINMDKEFLNFLHAPSYEQRLFCVKFNLSEWPNTKEYLDGTNTPYQWHKYLISGQFTFVTEKWENHRMTMKNTMLGWCESENTIQPSDESLFTFEAVSLENSTFRIQSAQRHCYVVMSYCLSFCRGSADKDAQGEWKIIQFHDKNYMLCLVNWPDLFLHMMFTPGGSVNGKRNPGRAGRWKISKIRQVMD